MDKKGQETPVGTIISLIIGVGIAVLILIFIGVFNGQTYNLMEEDIDAVGYNLVNGEAVPITANATLELAHSGVYLGTFSLSNTSGHIINSNNYTLDRSAGTVIVSPAAYSGATFLANYTWGAEGMRESIKGGIVSSFEALEQSGNYLPIVVLAVIIFLVLSLVVGFTVIGRNGNGGSAL